MHPDQYRRYMDFEAEARVIEHYAAHVVPGLLQTEAYARAFFSYAPDATEARTEERVSVRMGRQQRLRSAAAPRLWAVLDEAVVRRPVGEPEVMREQLAALLAIVDTAGTKVQVLPFSHGGHALMEGPLTLLKLTGGRSVAYEEGREAGRLHEDPEDVEQRRGLYDALRAYALPPKESGVMIAAAMEEYTSCTQARR
ncbi:DUF5753 domain-containing protein [Streptomyces oceani]|uniref:DUF5753 domain-containing protein n=1 Tax=Streptomyces oceani TaxID=1075402 RepID=UPI0026BB46D7